jgi:hypothetical protein
VPRRARPPRSGTRGRFGWPPHRPGSSPRRAPGSLEPPPAGARLLAGNPGLRGRTLVCQREVTSAYAPGERRRRNGRRSRPRTERSKEWQHRPLLRRGKEAAGSRLPE